MKMRISKRDILFFILGFFAFLLLELIVDPQGSLDAFNDGWNDARGTDKVEVGK